MTSPGATSTGTRREHDLLGDRDVPADAYYGVQTLRANENFLLLQEELSGVENKIAYARQFYNDSVNTYNTRRQSFPAVLAAASLGFGPMDLFNMPEGEREVPKVALR